MLSRALSLATVTLLIGGFAAIPAPAQNLEAGKSPSQIFAGTCNACHKSPRGLLKTVPAGSLPSFLRQHYTTSGEMASLLSAFLVSNGATDTRYVGAQPKSAKDAKSDAGPSTAPDHIDRFGRRQRPAAPAQEAARPDAAKPDAAKPDAIGLGRHRMAGGTSAGIERCETVGRVRRVSGQRVSRNTRRDRQPPIDRKADRGGNNKTQEYSSRHSPTRHLQAQFNG